MIDKNAARRFGDFAGFAGFYIVLCLIAVAIAVVVALTIALIRWIV